MQVSRGEHASRVGWRSFSERVRPVLDALTGDELDALFMRASDGEVSGPGRLRLFWRLGDDGLPDAGMLLDTETGTRRRLIVPVPGDAA
jgi:hypothetical protein